MGNWPRRGHWPDADPPRYYEHNLYLNGHVEQLLRLSGEDQPGRQRQVPTSVRRATRPSLVALFTVIDHRQIQSTKDKTKIYKDTKKLLVAKSQTFELLNKHAIKRAGWRDAPSMPRVWATSRRRSAPCSNSWRSRTSKELAEAVHGRADGSEDQPEGQGHELHAGGLREGNRVHGRGISSAK